jgi:hypothetical protein
MNSRAGTAGPAACRSFNALNCTFDRDGACGVQHDDGKFAELVAESWIRRRADLNRQDGLRITEATR